MGRGRGGIGESKVQGLYPEACVKAAVIQLDLLRRDSYVSGSFFHLVPINRPKIKCSASAGGPGFLSGGRLILKR